MHQSEGVSDLVRCHVTQGFVHHVVAEYLGTNAGVNSSGLNETPVMHEGDHVVIPDNIGHENLATPGVHVTRSHGIGGRGNGVTHAVVTDIVRVEIRIVGRVIFGDDCVLETGFLESDVPVLDTLFNGSSPFFGESVVHVENDRFHGFHAPAVDEFVVFHAVFVARVKVAWGAEEANASVLVTDRHGIFI